MRALLMTKKQSGGRYPNPSRTIFYYDFEDSNNRLADSSGNNNNASSATYITYETVGGQTVAKLSSAAGNIAFNGGYGSSIGTGNFTVSFWHYPVNPNQNYPIMFGMFRDISPYPGPHFFFDPANRNGLGNHIVYRMTGASQHAGTITASNLYNSWHHFVMTRNSGVIVCYVDGVQDCIWSGDTTAFPSSSPLYGYAISRASGSSQDFPAGAQGDKFILEKVGWSATDVQDYYNQTKSLYGIS